jgi:hypothetical protein
MKSRQILWAIVFGSMLAITGCGDDGGGGAGAAGGAGSGGTAGSAGSSGGDFCDTLCAACGGGEVECQQACDEGIGQVPGELDDCPDQLEALGSCLGANDCNTDDCDAEWTTWFTCIITGGLGV